MAEMSKLRLQPEQLSFCCEHMAVMRLVSTGAPLNRRPYTKNQLLPDRISPKTLDGIASRLADERFWLEPRRKIWGEQYPVFGTGPLPIDFQLSYEGLVVKSKTAQYAWIVTDSLLSGPAALEVMHWFRSSHGLSPIVRGGVDERDSQRLPLAYCLGRRRSEFEAAKQAGAMCSPPKFPDILLYLLRFRPDAWQFDDLSERQKNEVWPSLQSAGMVSAQDARSIAYGAAASALAAMQSDEDAAQAAAQVLAEHIPRYAGNPTLAVSMGTLIVRRVVMNIPDIRTHRERTQLARAQQEPRYDSIEEQLRRLEKRRRDGLILSF